MNWSERPTNNISILYTRVSLCVCSMVFNTYKPQSYRNKYHFSTDRDIPINLSTWKSIWKKDSFKRCPSNQHGGLCNCRTFQHCFHFVLLLLYLFQLDLFQYFQPQFIQISVLQSQVIPSGPKETRCTTHFPRLTDMVTMSSLALWINISTEWRIGFYSFLVILVLVSIISLLSVIQMHFQSVLSFVLSSLCCIVFSLPPSHSSCSSFLPSVCFHVQEGIPALTSLQWMRSGIT